MELHINGLSREKVREIILKLPRNQQYLIHVFKDGRRVFIRTDGKKDSFKNGKKIGKYNFRIFYEDENKQTKGVSYIEDVLVDLLRKRDFIGEDIKAVIEAIKESIELKPLNKIFEKYPKLKELEKKSLPGHSIELLLVLLKWSGIEEDVNYWGINPRTGKPYEGRYKPYNALVDLFIKEERLYSVIKKHRLASEDEGSYLRF